jgi:hypothetical protein
MLKQIVDAIQQTSIGLSADKHTMSASQFLLSNHHYGVPRIQQALDRSVARRRTHRSQNNQQRGLQIQI